MNFRLSDRAWKRWGEIDPYFSVVTRQEFRAGAIDTYRREFFEGGEAYVRDMLDIIANQFPTMQFGRALDFGCGVGRLALPLARHFSEVTGLDISPAMLKEARTNAGRAGLENVHFAMSDDILSEATGQFDLVHSYIVLQHIPVKWGMAYLDRMLSVLKPGGVASIHITLDRQQGVLRNTLYWAQKHLPFVHASANLLRGRSVREPMMQMNEYSFVDSLRLFERHCIKGPITLLDRQGSTLGVRMIGQKR